MLSHSALSDRTLSAGGDVASSGGGFGAIIAWVNLIPTYLARVRTQPTYFSFVRTDP